MKKITSPVKAIRAKCLDCCCDQISEVKRCPCGDCSLHPFRFGKNPFRSKRVLRVLPNGLPIESFGDRPGESRSKQSVTTNRTSSMTITGKVIRACRMIIENPTLSNASIEKACQLSVGTLSRKPHKTTFEKAKQTGIIPRDENGRIVSDGDG